MFRLSVSLLSVLLAIVLWGSGLSFWWGVLASVNIVTFGLYGFDKRQARCERYRIPEAMLHWAAMIGGSPGAALGQIAFRHKTRKLKFRIVFHSTREPVMPL